MLRLENDAFPWLGSRPIADITTKELLATVNRIVDRGAVESAHRVLQNCGQVLRYAIATGRAERNPAATCAGRCRRSSRRTMPPSSNRLPSVACCA
jgi:hypothetical protein